MKYSVVLGELYTSDKWGQTIKRAQS